MPRSQMAMFIARAVAGGDANVPDHDTVVATGRSYDCRPGSPGLYSTDVTTSNGYCRHVHYLR